MFTDEHATPSALPGNLRQTQLVTRRHASLWVRPGGAALVLSVGDDAYLLESRQMVLESVGYRVRSVPSIGIVEDEELRLVDLAVICHSVDEKRAAAIAISLHQTNPAVRVIRLTTQDRRPCDCFDQLLTSPAPGALLAAVDQMLTTGITRSGPD